MIALKKLKDVQISHDFFLLSDKIGYSADIVIDYFAEIEALVALWQSQQQVEIYTENSERKWGR